MATATSSADDVPSDHELDDILNGTLNGEDIFDTSNIQAQVQTPKKNAAEDAGLGIDEEIKVVRKRQPIPKLDENRLLSDPGIPKLRKISKERLRFKGKGHEYGDIARMLNMYQLWLDDLYPRAKFADGLVMIEKLGHTKRIQLMRKEWIDEGKPRHTTEPDDEDVEAIVLDQSSQRDAEPMEGVESDNTAKDREAESEAQGHRLEEPGDPTETTEATGADNPDEDELDALLAESGAPNTSLTSATLAQKTGAAEADDPFADDMEAIAEMEAMW